MTELIPEGAPPFIILTYSAAMMAVVAAQLNFIHHLDLSNFPLFSPLKKINMFTFGLVAFICFLVTQLLALLNVALQTHFFDIPIICLFLVDNAFIISWILWVIVYRCTSS